LCLSFHLSKSLGLLWNCKRSWQSLFVLVLRVFSKWVFPKCRFPHSHFPVKWGLGWVRLAKNFHKIVDQPNLAYNPHFWRVNVLGKMFSRKFRLTNFGKNSFVKNLSMITLPGIECEWIFFILRYKRDSARMNEWLLFLSSVSHWIITINNEIAF